MQQGSSATATLTDEQIIGLDPLSADDATSVAQDAPAIGTATADGNGDAEVFADALATTELAAGQMPQAPASSGRPEPQQTAAADPAWLRSLEAQPQGGREAAAEARAWRAAASDVAALDAAYFSADAGARSGLAARLYDSDPAAFRAMLAEGARMLSQRDPQALAELARQLGGPAAPAAAAASPSLRSVANQQPAVILSAAKDLSVEGNPNQGEILRRSAPQNDNINTNTAATFPADAYRSFEAATNDDVARRVNQAIDHTLSNTLPEGTGEGARRRIAADILQEVQATLAADRELSRRVGETLRDWRFDAAARQQVASLLSGRARAVLPEVARRVVTEWTSSVLVSDRAKTARIEAAANRREVTGGRLPEPVPPSALRPRNIDYRRTSDDQILDM